MKNRKIVRRKGRVSITVFLFIAFIIGITYLAFFLSGKAYEKAIIEKLYSTPVPEWVNVQIIGENCGGRSGRELVDVENIVIHYVGNPNTSAQANHAYFNKEKTKVCSHFIVGLDGEIIQCVPLYERSVASNWRNKDTISIEVCHPDESGKFNEETYNALIKLTAWLCDTLNLNSEDVIRHHDITGKLCPLYYVEHEDAWEVLKEDVGRKINEH